MASPLLPITPLAFRGDRWCPAPSAPASSSPAALTLVTWNVWFGRHMFQQRAAALLDELAWRAPQVVALQEVTVELLEILIAHPLLRSGYQLTDVDGSTFERYGVVLLSRIPFTHAAVMELPSQMGRRLVVGTLANGLSVATVHLESTSSCAAARVTQLGLVQPALRAWSEDVVWMGDMNFAPEAPSETAALEPDFVDAWAHSRFATPGFTVDSQRNEMRRKVVETFAQKRIDRVFVRSARWRVQDISLTGTEAIDRHGTYVSDHFGLETLLVPAPA